MCLCQVSYFVLKLVWAMNCSSKKEKEKICPCHVSCFLSKGRQKLKAAETNKKEKNVLLSICLPFHKKQVEARSCTNKKEEKTRKMCVCQVSYHLSGLNAIFPAPNCASKVVGEWVLGTLNGFCHFNDKRAKLDKAVFL